VSVLGENCAEPPDRALAAADGVAHLYVHIPFCPKICPYCSFYKEASDRHKTQPFLDAVLAELDRQIGRLAHCGRPLRPQTIFFGGGTPSALSTPQLEYLLGGLRARLDLSDLREWTLEMNPATVSLEKARALRDLGVNRVSMGVQSWEPQLLAVLGRVHSASQARRSYEILREAGFANVNLDLIFGVPTQTRAHWEDSLAATIALAPEHISAYNLTYEEDTEYFRRFTLGELSQDNDADAALFELTAETLENAGYEPYEISNFARPGRECAHNLAYWSGADYLGLGPSAFSTVGERARHGRIHCADRGAGGCRRFPGRSPAGDAARGTDRLRPAHQPGRAGGDVAGVARGGGGVFRAGAAANHRGGDRPVNAPGPAAGRHRGAGVRVIWRPSLREGTCSGGL
jgi:oxygen-independent coproporphyrinogen-3 oxidase